MENSAFKLNFNYIVCSLASLFFLFFSFSNLQAQNLIVNPDFETTDLTGWTGFNNQNLIDNITNSRVGNVNNAEGSLRQDVNVVGGEQYVLNFDYRWVSGASNYNMTIVVRKDSNNDLIESLVVSTTPDQWLSDSILFDVPAGETKVRIVFYKTAGNRPFRLDNVVLNKVEGNLIQNPRFTLNNTFPSSASWEGFNQNQRIDNITGEFVGFIDNDGTLRQDLPVVPGVDYFISFNYRWLDVGRANGNAITPQVRNPNVSGALGILQSLNLTENDSDVWYTAYFTYSHPINSPLDVIRLQFFKGLNFNQLHINNVTLIQNIDFTRSKDFVFANGTWIPSNPIGVSTLADDVLIYNGNAVLNGNVSANTVTIKPSADVDVENVLEVANNLVVEIGAKLTFKSSLTKSGQLKSGNVSGEVRVERYIPALTNNRRGFRFVTSAVNSTLPIYNNWQENGSLFIDKYGTHITGSATGLNGFDETTTGNPSMFTFNPSGWSRINDTDNTNLEAGKGYRLMIRGDRKYNLASNPVDAPNSDVILRASGTPLTGTLTTGVDLPALTTESNGFSLIGNPYQAVVDMDLVDKTNLLDYIYVWDATTGNYVVVEISSNSIEFPSASSSDASKFVAPGQSFFVRNITDPDELPVTSSITFEEADKRTDEPEVEVFSDNTAFYINSRLYKTENLQSGDAESDAISIRFHPTFTTLASDEDAPKIANPNENYAIINNGLQSIDNQNLPVDDHEIELLINRYTESNYSLSFVVGNKPENVEVLLIDAYLNTETVLNDDFVYDFSVDASIPASSAYNRFKINFDVETLSTTNIAFGDNFSMYPNPTSTGKFNIQTQGLTSDAIDVELFSMMGKKVFKETYPSTADGSIQVQTNQLNTGVYLVKLSQADQSFTSKLIIK